MTHAELLRLLLPPTSFDPNGVLLGAELAAEGAALDAAHLRAAQLLEEADPRTTLELLPDWERVAGLPDACAPLAATVQERRGAVVARLSGIGGQSAAFYIGLAKSLGYDVTVSAYQPFRAGISMAGDELTNEPWVHSWLVRAPETTTFDFKAGVSCASEPVRNWGAAPLECLIGKFKPAHTAVNFAYGV
jgi:uncharacterized protein YmfQ (DUF2313 family)